jgi:hypothetical protein
LFKKTLGTTLDAVHQSIPVNPIVWKKGTTQSKEAVPKT